MVEEKNIKIEVWVDNYYARFIGIWYPEEETKTPPPGEDLRPEQQRNLPKLVVLTSIFKGRREVIGNNPIVPSQHPMPASFLKEQTRAIAHMFVNDIGVFQPESKAQAFSFLSRMAVGFLKVKEMRLKLIPPKPSMTLFELKNSLTSFTDEQLKKINVAVENENPADVIKRDLESCFFSYNKEPLLQYIKISKLINVHDVANPYINNSSVPTLEQAKENLTGVGVSPIADASLKQTSDAIAKNEMELEMLKTIDRMAEDAGAKDIIPELTREKVQEETIKTLIAKCGDTK